MFYDNDHITYEEMKSTYGITGTGSWAVGGQALFLGDSNWYTKMSNDWFRDYKNQASTYWTGMVININYSDVHLMVGYKSSGMKPADFRTAMLEHICLVDTDAESRVYRGIILDGGGSSQLVCNGINFPGSTRKLVGVITLRNK